MHLSKLPSGHWRVAVNERICERCGGPNPGWFSPEFTAVIGSSTGILCPTCFVSILQPEPNEDGWAMWMITRLARDDGQQRLLTEILRGCGCADDAERLAGCVIDAGWRQCI